MFCMKCGAQIEEGNAFCMKCGAKAPKMQPNVPGNAPGRTDVDDDRTVMADNPFYQAPNLDGSSGFNNNSGYNNASGYNNNSGYNNAPGPNNSSGFKGQLSGMGQGQNVNHPQNNFNRTVPSVNTYNGPQAPLNSGFNNMNNAANAGNHKGKQPKEAKQKKKGSAGLVVAIIFLVLSILAVLGVGGYFAYQTFFADSQYEAVSIDDELSATSKKKDKDKDKDSKSSSGKKSSKKSETEEEEDDKDSAAGAADAAETEAAVAETTVIETTAETTAAFVQPVYSLNYKTNYSFAGLMQVPMLNVTESSYLVQKDTGYINYGKNAFDGDLKTSWQDGVSGNGLNEWIHGKFDRTYNVKAISFALGNHRSKDWYLKNNRPSILCITVGECYYDIVFPDQYEEFVVEFSEPIPSDFILVGIGGCYPGTKYNDMTIAEIGVYGN
ncbi:zinc-ribbon domain-containing protein [Oribacterium sp. KHPX15]|uniref:zinc ribbon domain-containing protein n=1 Tax=Oribacterium sp. KHPX15 TaxID=1855342 RepID=UPI0008988792|nr:zinc ribbon domain-containing protein [Oribacterium sp. KHPX15]SDZ97027.1 zinc-ribbon domain-containing protein [Oribacterium sp. KHPX15]